MTDDIGLVIFDCDGVLVDSEPISIAVLTEMISEAGADLSEAEAYKRFLGKSVAAVVEGLHRENGISLSADDLAEMRRRLYQRFRSELQPVPGVADAISTLDHPVCVASSSQPERIRLSLSVTGLLPYFDTRIYSSSMVPRGKPAPDLFLHVANTMRVKPCDCLVIEDSVAGIAAAKAAGMRVAAFVGGAHAIPAGLASLAGLLMPDVVFRSMSDLPDIINRLGSPEPGA